MYVDAIEDIRYNLDAILLLGQLIISYCIISITLTLIRECQADDNFAGQSMLADEHFASCSILIICFKLAIKAKCPMGKTQITGRLKAEIRCFYIRK